MLPGDRISWRNRTLTLTALRSRSLRYGMTTIWFASHQFPLAIIGHAGRLDVSIRLQLSRHSGIARRARTGFLTRTVARFSLADKMANLLAGRGLDVSYETVRQWVWRFGPLLADALFLRAVSLSGTLAAR